MCVGPSGSPKTAWLELCQMNPESIILWWVYTLYSIHHVLQMKTICSTYMTMQDIRWLWYHYNIIPHVQTWHETSCQKSPDAWDQSASRNTWWCKSWTYTQISLVSVTHLKIELAGCLSLTGWRTISWHAENWCVWWWATAQGYLHARCCMYTDK